MSCDDVRRLLDLVDEDRRCDPPSLRRHLASCADCRGRYPEVALLLPAAADATGPTRRRRLGVYAAAAAIVILTAALVWRERAAPTTALEPTPVAAS